MWYANIYEILRKYYTLWTDFSTSLWFLFNEYDFAISNLISVISAKAYEISPSVRPLEGACLYWIIAIVHHFECVTIDTHITFYYYYGYHKERVAPKVRACYPSLKLAVCIFFSEFEHRLYRLRLYNLWFEYCYSYYTYMSHVNYYYYLHT